MTKKKKQTYKALEIANKRAQDLVKQRQEEAEQKISLREPEKEPTPKKTQLEEDDYELSIKNEVSLEQTEMQMEEKKYDEYKKLYEKNLEILQDLELQVARFRYFLSDNLEQVSSNPEDTSREEQANYISWAWKRFFPSKKKK